MTVEELQVLITANTNELRKEIKNVQQNVAGLSKSATKTGSSFTSSFIKASVFTKLLGTAVKLVASNLSDAVSRLDTLNNYTNVMSNLGVNSEDAEASIQRLSDKLTGLPTTLDDAVTSVQRFTSANGNVKASTDMFLALNNAILAGGASTEIQSSALEQLRQSYSKGSMDMQEWRSAMTAMPAQLKQVATAMGYVSVDKLGEAIRNGNVSMNDFMSTIVKLNKEGVNGFQSFEQQAMNSTGGVKTSMTNVKTAITRGLAEIMNAIGQSNIAGFFQGITKAINKVIPYITGFVKACVWAVSSITSLFGGKTKTKEKVDAVSKSMSNLGTSTSSTASDIDDATGSAKKLTKALGSLTSFDEMNVLSDNSNSDSSSGSSSGSSGGMGNLGDFDFSDWDTGLSTTSSKADEIAEHIKSVFSTVGETVKSVWDSEPVQAYVGLVKSKLGFAKDYAVQIGTDLWTNMTTTWNDIKDNVGITISNMSTLFTNMFNDMANGIDTWGQPIIDGTSKLFNSIWTDAVDPVIQLISQEWADFSGILVDLWDKHGKPLIDNIGEFCTKTIDLFQSIWDNVIDPIIQPFLEQLTWLWDEHIKGLIEEIGDFVGTLINNALEVYNKVVEPIISWLLEKLSPAWSFLSNLVVSVFATLVGAISDGVKNILKFFKNMSNFISGVFTGDWKKAWEGISGIFKTIVDGLVSVFKIPINLIIDLLNSFIAGINKIKVPDWVPGVGGKGINIPKIKKLARGGVVDSPTVAMIGEAGKEAIMPLENNTGWIDNLANKLADKVGNGGSPIQLTVKLGEDTIYKKFIDYIDDKNFESNGEAFNI